LPEGGPDQFFPSLKAFASAHGFQFKLDPVADDPKFFVFQLVRTVIIVDGQNAYDSQRQSYIAARYHFAFLPNYLKYPNLDPVGPLRPVVDGLLEDFQTAMKSIGRVTIDK